MQKLNLPEYIFKITTSEDNTLWIYDSLRKKKVVLSPEEWVRQNIIRFLIEEKMYPSPLISIESGIKINYLAKRFDALVYNRQGKSIMLIECKAPGIKINQNAFDQISAYNLIVKARYMLITNGLNHYCCKLNETKKTFDFLEEIPSYEEL